MEGSAPLDPAAAGPTGTGSAPTPAAVAASARARRPAVVTILAVVQLLSATAYGLILAILLVDGPAVLDALAAGSSDGPSAIDLETAALVVIVGGLCVATLAAGILLLRMRQLGWTITMLLAGLTLALSLVTWLVQGAPLEVWVLVQIATVFYLNQRQVRDAFGISGHLAGFAPDRSQE